MEGLSALYLEMSQGPQQGENLLEILEIFWKAINNLWDLAGGLQR